MPDIITVPALQSVPGLNHGFFTRGWGHCGLSTLFDPAICARNRSAVAAELHVAPTHLLSCYQIHSANCVTVETPWSHENRPQADAMVTNQRGIALGILTADCVPVLFVDAEAGVIGAAHAGWRGAFGGVLENTLMSMVGLGARLSRIQAALGPCIWQNSYEVGPEFPAPFIEQSVDHERYFVRAERTGSFLFDLPGYVCGRLEAVGVTAVQPSPADTYADPARFYSYRRNTQNGISPTESMISVIVLN